MSSLQKLALVLLATLAVASLGYSEESKPVSQRITTEVTVYTVPNEQWLDAMGGQKTSRRVQPMIQAVKERQKNGTTANISVTAENGRRVAKEEGAAKLDTEALLEGKEIFTTIEFAFREGKLTTSYFAPDGVEIFLGAFPSGDKEKPSTYMIFARLQRVP